MAVAGLVLAFLFAPVGLVLSLIALGRTGQGKQGGRGLAIAGVIVSGAWVLLVVIILGAVASSGNDESVQVTAVQPVAPDPAPAAPSAAAEVPPSVAPTPEAVEAVEPPPAATGLPGIGVPATDGEFTFTVTRVENVGTTVGEGIMAETAQGEFVVVYVSVSNTGNEAKTFSSSGQVLFDDQNREYETSSALFSLPDADKAFLENINPGNAITDAPLLFDIAPGTVVDRVRLHDVFYSPGVEMSLR